MSAGWNKLYCQLFCKKNVFETVNGFDATLKSGGDWEFSMRCVSKGYVMEYGADVIMRHPARKGLKAMLKNITGISAGDHSSPRKNMIADSSEFF